MNSLKELSELRKATTDTQGQFELKHAEDALREAVRELADTVTSGHMQWLNAAWVLAHNTFEKWRPVPTAPVGGGMEWREQKAA